MSHISTEPNWERLNVGQPVFRIGNVQTPKDAVVIASAQMVNEAIARIAGEIAQWILPPAGTSDAVSVVGLLNGGKFVTDRLCQALTNLGVTNFTRIDVKVSTRDANGQPLSTPSISGDVAALAGKRVLIVDDILDSGITLRLVHQMIEPHASQFATAVLVEKDDPKTAPSEDSRLKPDFVGLKFTDARWFSGCGMDMPDDPRDIARDMPCIIAYPPCF